MIEQKQERFEAEIAIYTVGYEGKQIDRFLNELMVHGIQRVIDIRSNPIARRYGYHGSTLRRLCKKLKIDYVHTPELGIVGELRQNLNTYSDWQKLFDYYKKNTIEKQKDKIIDVIALIQEKASVLVCQEADPQFCHRSILSNEIEQRTGLPIKHITGELCQTNQPKLKF
jgi:uncharacterized protein (DUF488 family)